MNRTKRNVAIGTAAVTITVGVSVTVAYVRALRWSRSVEQEMFTMDDFVCGTHLPRCPINDLINGRYLEELVNTTVQEARFSHLLDGEQLFVYVHDSNYAVCLLDDECHHRFHTFLRVHDLSEADYTLYVAKKEAVEDLKLTLG